MKAAPLGLLLAPVVLGVGAVLLVPSAISSLPASCIRSPGTAMMAGPPSLANYAAVLSSPLAQRVFVGTLRLVA